MDAQDWIGRLLLDRYRPVHVLAQGGQGIVYLARAEGAAGFTRPVVVKRILPDHTDNEHNSRLFLREAKLLADMDHPNILDIVDLDEEDGDYIMVLEYVRGFHLGRWQRLRRTLYGEFPWEFAVHAATLVCDALAHVHNRTGPDGQKLGIVHRDVTPANILVDVEGAVKLADFGIARSAGDRTEQIDGQDVVRGNFAYVAPEVFIGNKVSTASDIYSVGMVLHRLITGTRAQAGPSLESTVYKALYEEPARLDEVREDVPEELADLVAEAIDKEPEERVASAAEFAQRLRGLTHPDVPQLFAEAAKADFEREDAAELLKAQPLNELEHLWRTFDPASVVRPDEGAGARKVWIAAGLAVALMAGAFVMLWSRFTAEPAGVVVVNTVGEVDVTDNTAVEDRRPGTEGAAATPPSDAGSPPADAGNEEPSQDSPDATSAEAPVPVAPNPQILARTFNRRLGGVRACANRHSPDDVVQARIRFEVGTSGAVQAAQVTGATGGLQSCLVGVARGTRFGPLTSRAAFTIPITVRPEPR